jgi:hypothetical protein
LLADGSARADARRVVVDRDAEPYRWRCPNGHTSWERTNSHGWCPQCAHQSENNGDVHPEHWEIYDARNDETISYARLEFR